MDLALGRANRPSQNLVLAEAPVGQSRGEVSGYPRSVATPSCSETRSFAFVPERHSLEALTLLLVLLDEWLGVFGPSILLSSLFVSSSQLVDKLYKKIK